MAKVKIKIVPFNDPSVANNINDRFNDCRSYRQQWEGQWKVNEMNLYNSKGTLNTSDIETGATSIVDHSLATASVWRHTSIAADFTANFTNVPTTDNRVIGVALMLVQGASAYLSLIHI